MNGLRPTVLLALTPPAERAIEELLFGPDAPITVAGSASDANELIARTDREPAGTVLVSPDLTGLSESVCGQLRAAGTRLVGIALDDRDAERLTALGLDPVLGLPLTTAMLKSATRLLPAPQPKPADTSNQEGPETESLRRAKQGGGIVAVVGSAGSPGSSEFAASIAALAAARWRSLLVECDLLAGSLDLRLGADPRAGSLLALVRAQETDHATGELIERWTCGSEHGWPEVLLAPADIDSQIGELAQPGAIRAALQTCAASYQLVVSDVGPLLTTPAGVPAVAHCHREALLAADAVVLVIGAAERQLRAGRRQLTTLLETLAITPDRLRICINGLGAPGTAARAEIDDALGGQLADLGLAVDWWLPYDRRALTAATRRGIPLAAARPGGGYARALTAALDDLLLPARPLPRRRKQRLAIPAVAAAAGARSRLEEVRLPWRS